MAWTIEVRNLVESQRALDNMAKGLGGAPMLQAMKDATMVVTRQSMKDAPRDMGKLSASITPVVELGPLGPRMQYARKTMRGLIRQEYWPRGGGRVLTGIVGSNVLYAPFMEFGTRPHWPPPGALARWAERHGMSEFVIRRAIGLRGTRPHPYLIPALTDNEDKIVELFERAVTRIVRF